jgi:hypothetical protein
VRGALLVPHEHVLELRALEDGVVDRQHDAARVAEHHVDALGL